MDSSDIDITFDSLGVCNHCTSHVSRVENAPFSRPDWQSLLERQVETIRRDATDEYDCVIGLSGGVDSSFLALKAVELGLKPLAVHFDNGWNSELAVRNIERIVERLKLDLVTFVIDWEEFRDIQRSFFLANVIDIELVTDHAIFAAMFKIAREHRIGYILSGTNVATESIMPVSWQHFKFDLRNLKAIHARYGTIRIQRFPTLGIAEFAWNHYVRRLRSVNLLNFIHYKKFEAMHRLEQELGWTYYGGKHYESVFTKFYQAHILPTKFGVDKRRTHLSDLLLNGEITREEAQSELAKPLYNATELEQDLDYVCKKLGFTRAEMDAYLKAPPVSHFDYPSNAAIGAKLSSLYKRVRYS